MIMGENLEFQSCPICLENKSLTEILSINFGIVKDFLPDKYKYVFCGDCDFLFQRPIGLAQGKLDEYYSKKENDYSLSFPKSYSGGSRFSKQVSQIEKVLDDAQLKSLFDREQRSISDVWTNKQTLILDYGSGDCGLLYNLIGRDGVGNFTLYGVDVAYGRYSLDERRLLDGKLILESKLSDIPIGTTFDFIVISHTLEHLLDFQVLSELASLLSTNGVLIVEVPNANKYITFPRQTPFYYFDRLHINHFSQNSLSKLLNLYGFFQGAIVEYEFQYSDTLNYPALLGAFTRTSANKWVNFQISELERLQEFSIFIRNEKLVVWGVGDNFWRLHSLGAFSESCIVAFIDRAHSGSSILDRRVMTPEDCLRSFPKAKYCVTISWENREVIKWLTEQKVEFFLI